MSALYLVGLLALLFAGGRVGVSLAVVVGLDKWLAVRKGAADA